MAISERSQTVIVWWALAFAGIYGIALVFCLHMVPPPGATKSAADIAGWYAARATEIKLGATVTAYCGAFALPLWAVIAVQIARQEKGRPIWALIAALGGALLSLMLVLPPLFWGVAAFTAGRSPEVTSLMHELGVLTLVTPVQYNPFAFVPIIVVCFLPQTAARSPFPRWYGYFTAWAALMFEAGPLAFDTRTVRHRGRPFRFATRRFACVVESDAPSLEGFREFGQIAVVDESVAKTHTGVDEQLGFAVDVDVVS